MVHLFNIDDVYAAVDTNSGSVHILDEITYELLQNEIFRDKEEVEKIVNKYNRESVDESLEEIESLIENGMLYTAPLEVSKDMKTAVKALCLNVAHDCNLKCNYCFASQGNFGGTPCLMPFEVGKKALDFLVANSGNRVNLEVDFFGGEPLMNFDVVKQLVQYGRSIEKEHNKHFRFTTTTNGILLDDDKIDFINENMDNVVLSLDGRKEVNDRMRRTVNDKGSYDVIVEKFKKMADKRKGKSYFTRGTFTAFNLDFAEDVKHIHDLGFKSISVEPVVTEPSEPYALLDEHVDKLKDEYEKLARYFVECSKSKENKFDFFHFYIDLDHGPCLYKRSIGCGAGVEYIAVTPEGTFYPCHQFVGDEKFVIGNVDEGITKPEICNNFKCVTVNNKEKCHDCWAKYYCSGGCHANAYNFNGTIKEPYSVGCELERKRVECAIYIKAKQLEDAE